MDKIDFINKIKNSAIRMYKEYKIIPSLTIAQGILESKSGESDLAIQANNLFGIKWRENCGYDRISVPTKEFENGQWITINAYFRKYNNWEESIQDHALFLQKERYQNLIGDTNYKSVCQKIYQDGYATDPNYPLKLINLIEQYSLNQYDNFKNNINGGNFYMSKFAIDPGHGCYPDTGAEGYLNEQNCALDVANSIIAKLNALGHTAWCARPSSASSVTNSLQQRCDSADNADYLVSIHLNASDGIGHGTEVYAMSSTGYELAERVVNNLAALGWTNRGTKDGSGLYVIRHSNPAAILIEICFIDNNNDSNLYNNLGSEKIADAIVKGLVGQTISTNGSSSNISSSSSRLLMLTDSLMYGQDIIDVQTKLKKIGYDINIDGYYGNNTYNVVCKFQSDQGMSYDGIVGNDTLKALDAVLKIKSSESEKSQFSSIDHSIVDNSYVTWKSSNGIGYIETVPEMGRINIHLDKYNYITIQDDEKEGNNVWIQTRTKGTKKLI